MITKLLALPFLAILALGAAVIGLLVWIIFAPFAHHVKTGKEDDSDLFT